MARGLQLPPFAVILGVFVGREVAGLAGIDLSVPAMAAFRILLKNWKLRTEVSAMVCHD
jgi:predicted PurR-regulated permease PerM